MREWGGVRGWGGGSSEKKKTFFFRDLVEIWDFPIFGVKFSDDLRGSYKCSKWLELMPGSQKRKKIKQNEFGSFLEDWFFLSQKRCKHRWKITFLRGKKNELLILRWHTKNRCESLKKVSMEQTKKMRAPKVPKRDFKMRPRDVKKKPLRSAKVIWSKKNGLKWTFLERVRHIKVVLMACASTEKWFGVVHTQESHRKECASDGSTWILKKKIAPTKMVCETYKIERKVQKSGTMSKVT